MFRFALALLAAFSISQAAAHEYYLMPGSFTAETGAELPVRHRLGQRFNGNEMPYIGRWNVRSEVWKSGEKIEEVRGIDGDRPALTIVPETDGLYSIIHQSNHSTYAPGSWEKFSTYLTNEKLAAIIAAHDARGLDKEAASEAYARYAKTLVAVGDGTGADAPTGLAIELVALENPVTFNVAKPLPVQLLFDGKPLAGRSVKLFVGIDTEPKGYFLTDANGVMRIPAQGKGPYLLNAIEMIEPRSDTAEAKAAQWESFWASLTFQRGR
ncbi:MAG: DUF4198 domain-containing protein [Pseudomonadota bacterium]